MTPSELRQAPLEQLRAERNEAEAAHLRSCLLVEIRREDLEVAIHAANLTRKAWLDLGQRVNELEKAEL